jgi:DNA-directed RNA polymerase specialized sigma24 family protein
MNPSMSCSCSICGLEQSLFAGLRNSENQARYRQLTAHSSALSRFATPLELLGELHDRDKLDEPDAHCDRLLGELVRLCRDPNQEIGRHLLLLVLMPAAHRTCRQVAALVPSLERDDIAQQLIAVLLEYTQSETFQTLTSHFAFALARRMRRGAFRWATREARFARNEGQTEEDEDPEPLGPVSSLEAPVVLRDFLRQCVANQVLSEGECELLLLSKLEGVSSQRLNREAKVSSIAFKHRLQRVINRLRRAALQPAAKKRPGRAAEDTSMRVQLPRPGSAA